MPLELNQLPFLWSVTWGIHTTLTPPQALPSSSDSEKVLPVENERFVSHAIPIMLKTFFCGLALGETLISIKTHLSNPFSPPPCIQVQSPWFLGWLLTLIGTFIVLACHWTLGRYFTGFDLRIQHDHKLVTVGPYAYVRHPSYIGTAFVGVGSLMYHLSPTTSLGSFLGGRLTGISWISSVIVVAIGVGSAMGLRRRMKREDEMMREAFGEAWERWAKQVPWWLIPGIY